MIGNYIKQTKEEEADSNNYCSNCGAWWNECTCDSSQTNVIDTNSSYIDDEEDESSFSAVSVVSLEDTEANKYTHWSEGLIMYITKDGVTMALNSEEIEQIVKCLPRTMGGSY